MRLSVLKCSRDVPRGDGTAEVFQTGRFKSRRRYFTGPSWPIEQNSAFDVYRRSEQRSNRCPYGKKRHKAFALLIISLEQKARIGKYAADHRTTNAMRHFTKDFPNLHESTVRGWKSVYLKEVGKQVKASVKDVSVERLPEVQLGRPLLLSNQLDRQVRDYLNAFCDVGGVVNTSIAIAAATGTIRRCDSNLLAVNGGHILFTKHWA